MGVIRVVSGCKGGRRNNALFSKGIEFWLLGECCIELANECFPESALGENSISSFRCLSELFWIGVLTKEVTSRESFSLRESFCSICEFTKYL